ncbi:O-antigen ligase [Aliikangiella sp. G2MR2-5]|uniref:O-antigen ligase family protein n=1 Tax=Aliikangiella sp. G2MR2-5 TaxID=2788943 RepID=UPI0018A907BA|nr:O-antigen ligase family protein [Aliikangiella sp. G2MR2-5]
MIFLYLITLLIAPQLWIEPFIGLRTDLIVYPLWFIVLMATGKMKNFTQWDVLDTILLAYIFWIILASFANDTNALTTTRIVNYIKWFILYKLVVASVADMEGIQKAAYRLALLVMVIVVEGIQHKLSPDGLGWAGQTLGWVDRSVLEAGGTGRTRWINIFDGPGVFCVLYTLGLPFILQFLDKHYGAFKKILSIAALAPLLLAIWYTGSRGGFLATMGIVGMYLLFRNIERLNLSIGKIFAVGGLCFAALILAPSHLTQVKDDNNSAQHRVDMWMQGIEMISQNPLFGIGRGNYADYTGSLIAHNSAIENMGELGFPGLFLWIAAYFWAFRNIYFFVVHSDNSQEQSIARSVSLALVGYLISSMFVTLEYETQFFLLGLAGVVARTNGEKLKFTKKDFWMIFMITLGWVALIRVFVSLYY